MALQPLRAFSVGAQASLSTEKVTDDSSNNNNKTPQSTVTCVYQTHVAGYWRNVTITWGKNLMNSISLNLIINSLEGETSYSFKLDLKPWHFWSKRGSKGFELEGSNIEIHWDLRSAKFIGTCPEPAGDYYVAVVCDEEIVLLLGNYKNKVYKRTKAKPTLVEAVLVSKKENVFAKKSFATRAKFDEKKQQEHDIIIESSTSGLKDPEMWISIDGLVMVHVKNLQWKFRGNQVVTVNKQPVQIFWDVHDWLFNGEGGGGSNSAGSQGLFTFKPGAPDLEEDDGGDSPHGNSDVSDGTYFSTKSNNGASSDFCLLLFAWKIE
ncbi:unnamed protein product [Linum tenue]|uniref:Uncharacterized protein n=1 Tax=Linum tenue TaxID=586396 RepID=A0AAV0M2U0_9ROSI|nr:unnamed protein product [Linum tenue]